MITPSGGRFLAGPGTTSLPITFNLANIGGAPSGALTTTLAGVNASDFVITDNKCLLPLASLSTCAIQMVFKPTSEGSKGATLSVSDATPGAAPASASLNGANYALD